MVDGGQTGFNLSPACEIDVLFRETKRAIFANTLILMGFFAFSIYDGLFHGTEPLFERHLSSSTQRIFLESH